MDVLITGTIGIVSSIISGWASWIFARRKYNSEVDGNLIQNMKDSLEFYGTLSDDNKHRLEGVLQDNEHLRATVDELLKENKQLKKELGALKDQMIRLTTSICTDLSCQLRSKDYSTLSMIENEKSKLK